MPKRIDTIPVRSQKLTPKQFIERAKSPKDMANIRSVSIVPPRLGRSGLGSIVVTYKDPVHVPAILPKSGASR